MTKDDLAAVEAIAAVVHPGYPEALEVFAERLSVYPAGCWVLLDAEGQVVGYALTHPWVYGQPPKLNILLGAIPAQADTYYLHDVALLPAARGRGAVRMVLKDVVAQADLAGQGNLSLVSVNESRPIWERCGFRLAGDVTPDLSSYGGDACFMTRP
ncbi:MAG: GNAT family N-acetyltransferase [Rhodospirillaceae bacterium]|nr:GNAT family N-acetyltransferase [Rhodospirillaceae bacterium]